MRGRVESVHVHLLEAQRWGDTAATAYGDILRATRSPRASAWHGWT